MSKIDHHPPRKYQPTQLHVSFQFARGEDERQAVWHSLAVATGRFDSLIISGPRAFAAGF